MEKVLEVISWKYNCRLGSRRNKWVLIELVMMLGGSGPGQS